METHKVVILAGGQGTRIREETEFRPKPMVPIGNRPILWHIMKIYGYQGFKEFVICLGYKGELIKEYFFHYKIMYRDFTINLRNDRQIWLHDPDGEEDWTVTLADTGLRAMTGARIKRIERYIRGETFMLTYGDGVADVDLRALLKFHRAHGKIATVTGIHPPARFGELISEGNQVVQFSEKPQARGGLINGGFLVFNRGVFEYLRDDDACALEQEPLVNLARDGQLMVYHHPGFWQCMDTVRDMNLLNELWESGKPPWKIWD